MFSLTYIFKANTTALGCVMCAAVEGMVAAAQGGKSLCGVVTRGSISSERAVRVSVYTAITRTTTIL